MTGNKSPKIPNAFIPMTRMKRRLATMLLLVTVAICNAFASIMEDSIRESLHELNGESRLLALSELCSLAHADDNMDHELRCIRDYLDEAIRQNDVESVGNATVMQLSCYLNYECLDSISHYLPTMLERMKKNKTWDYYYNCWDLAIQSDIFHDKLESALREAEKMYRDAQKRSSDYGIGIALFDMGVIYQAIGETAEAVDVLEKSIGKLKDQADITMVLSAYNYLCASLDGLGRYQRIIECADEWKNIIDNYEAKAESMGYTPQLGGKRMYNLLAYCIAEIGLGNYEKAREYLDTARECAKGRSNSQQYKLMQIESRYYGATGQYEKAIEISKKNIGLLESTGDSVSVATMKTALADLLFKSGNYEEAAHLYYNLNPVTERIRAEELSRRLDDLHTTYEIDTLTLQSQATRTKLWLSIVTIVALLVILILYVVYAHKLKDKNRALFNIIREYDNQTSTLKPLFESENSNSGIDGENSLFRRVSDMMRNEMIYRNPNLNRESLAAAVGSNTVYLADAIRDNTGMTVNEYINGFRISHAAGLLTQNPDISIGDVETQSGFNSRSTFSRLFRNHFGMSPSEYKIISKEKANKN